MTEQGAGGYAVIVCHSCRQPVAFDTGTPLHLDDTPLCDEHVPECWAKYPSDPPAWCICDELLACEKRVLGEGIQKLLIAEGVRGFIEYGKSRWNKGSQNLQQTLPLD